MYVDPVHCEQSPSAPEVPGGHNSHSFKEVEPTDDDLPPGHDMHPASRYMPAKQEHLSARSDY